MTNERSHGTRARYTWGPSGQQSANGCRCYECTSAAVLYNKILVAKQRRGWKPYHDNTEARQHLLWLQTQGIGLRQVEIVSGVSRSALEKIRSGKRLVSRPETIEAILAVHRGKAAAGAHVLDMRIPEMINELKSMGYSARCLAIMLGYKCGHLNLTKSGRITPAKAARIEALYRELTAERDAQREFDASRQRDLRKRKMSA